MFLSQFTNQMAVNLARGFIALHLVDDHKWEHKVGEMLQLRAVLDRVPDHLTNCLSSAFLVSYMGGHSYLFGAYIMFQRWTALYFALENTIAKNHCGDIRHEVELMQCLWYIVESEKALSI